MFDLIVDGKYSGRDFYNFDSTSLLPRHRWYYLKEGFSAALVKEAINHIPHRTPLKILEPFCGTGTTLVTSALMNNQCTAIEVNPFLAFTARVKGISGTWLRDSFETVLNKTIVSSSAGSYSHLEDFSTFTEGNGNEKWLFNKSVLRRFTSLNQSISEYGGVYQNALKLAAIVAAYQCCNAKRDGKALRYKANWSNLNFSSSDFVEVFRKHAFIMMDDIQRYPINQEFEPKVIVGDSRNELAQLPDASFDLVVTSPPYLNSFDYSDVYRPELFLSEYVKNNKELTQIRMNTIRSHIQAKWSEEISFESPLLNPIMMQLESSDKLWDKRIPLMVKAYFDDLWKVFCQLKQKLIIGGQIWLVVSTSAYGGIHIPVDFILADAANNAGFRLEGIHCLRHLRAAGQQWKTFQGKSMPLRESLIIMINK